RGAGAEPRSTLVTASSLRPQTRRTLTQPSPSRGRGPNGVGSLRNVGAESTDARAQVAGRRPAGCRGGAPLYIWTGQTKPSPGTASPNPNPLRPMRGLNRATAQPRSIDFEMRPLTSVYMP